MEGACAAGGRGKVCGEQRVAALRVQPVEGQPMTTSEQKLQRKLRDTRAQRDRATGRVRELRDYCTKYQLQIVALQARLRQNHIRG